MKKKIDINYEAFTEAEKKVAIYIYEHEEEVLYMSIATLAKAAEVGEATAVRFCRKLGYKGFQDFKIELAKNIDKVITCKEENNYKDEVARNVIEAIHLTKETIVEEEIEKVIGWIKEAKNFYLYGVGSSGITAQVMEGRLVRVGYNAKAVIDPHFQAMTAANLTEEDLVVVFSLSGRTKDIIHAIEIAKQMGAKVVAITGDLESEVAKLSDQVILTSAKEGPLDGGSLVSQISQLYAIDLICTAIALKDIETIKKIRRDTYDAISNKRV